MKVRSLVLVGALAFFGCAIENQSDSQPRHSIRNTAPDEPVVRNVTDAELSPFKPMSDPESTPVQRYSDAELANAPPVTNYFTEEEMESYSQLYRGCSLEDGKDRISWKNWTAERQWDGRWKVQNF